MQMYLYTYICMYIVYIIGINKIVNRRSDRNWHFHIPVGILKG